MKFRRIMVTVLVATFLTMAVAEEQSQAQGFAHYTLTVTAKGEHLAGRQLLFAVFDSKENYLQTPIEKRKAVANDRGEASVSFEQLAVGTYAVVAVDDVDNNGELNRDERGFPTESLAFSNTPRLRRGPPKFSKAAFEHQMEQSIELIFNQRSTEKRVTEKASVEADADGLRSTAEPAL